MKIQIVEVGPRDGLQNEKQALSRDVKLELISRLSRSGLERIEIGAFVRPDKIPQMADSKELTQLALKQRPNKNVRYSALVPNEKGMNDALESGLKEVAVFGAASETFSQRNINCSIDESFARFEPVLKIAKTNKIKVRGYLSTCFGCPYEGKVPAAKVAKLAERMLKMGIFEISIGDTIGVATPKQVRAVLKLLTKTIPLSKIALHFHDTRGTALANILAGLDFGVRVVDSSLGGLGGCPYAPGASGNVATEDVVYMLEGMGMKTGVDLQALIDASRWMSEQLGRTLPSHVGRAGISGPYFAKS
ncbi:MAG TPA: hydroxymethylglutaryl-CoA lyase [Bdellovibrionales bacterium]|nr:hydroxymethylglutaryl-CoA lyase [Bdellovibrionales bacterium]